MDGRNVLAHYRTSRLSRGLIREVAGVGDFDGDGRDDLLLRSEIDGSWHYYRMNGWRVLRGSGRARLTRDLAWQVAGIADLNGDSKDDVLLRKTDGRWYFYPMDGRTVLPGRGTVRMTWDLAWRLVGFGHFDGDVRKSVLLRHPDGRWWYYRIQGRQVELGPLAVDLPDDTSETVAGVGDLNGDGHTDVLVRHADGGWHYHALYGGRVASFGTGLPGALALSEDLAWGALSCSNRGSTALPGRTLIDSQDKTVLLSTAFGHDQTLTYQVRSSEPDVLRASVTADVLTLMPVTEGRSTVTVTGRDPDGNSATQAFAVRYALNTFQDCAECPTMVIVPAGTFTMGAPESEIDSGYPGGIGSEQPQRTVSIPAFAASAHEVTFAEWDACAAAGACPVDFTCFTGACETILPDPREVCVNDPNVCHTDQIYRVVYYPDDNGWGRRDRPVINVRWFHARQYVDWLSRRFGQPYRLLTESEWEYAARAGTTTPFHTGETITPRQANFDCRGYTCSDYRGKTVPVGSFAPNGFGLYDMHGNVREWVQDCWGSYSTAPSDGRARDGCDRWTTLSVLRGGGWNDWHAAVRSASRRPANTGEYWIDIGFRVARTLDP